MSQFGADRRRETLPGAVAWRSLLLVETGIAQKNSIDPEQPGKVKGPALPPTSLLSSM